mmetsp:Transcript_21760/g.51996  ORF Transcript_21760/g.51996 Transcript_21760/m.51996 type:complete len:221 (-) Transcript_21760:179-841(-)
MRTYLLLPPGLVTLPRFSLLWRRAVRGMRQRFAVKRLATDTSSSWPGRGIRLAYPGIGGPAQQQQRAGTCPCLPGPTSKALLGMSRLALRLHGRVTSTFFLMLLAMGARGTLMSVGRPRGRATWICSAGFWTAAAPPRGQRFAPRRLPGDRCRSCNLPARGAWSGARTPPRRLPSTGNWRLSSGAGRTAARGTRVPPGQPPTRATLSSSSGWSRPGAHGS